MIRRIEEADIPWLVALAEECHEDWTPDMQTWRTWVTSVLPDNRVIAFRGEHAAAIACMSMPPWKPGERNCELMHLFSRPNHGSAFEPIRVLQAVDAARLEAGCRRFFIFSTAADLTPFALRLGAKPVGSLHVLEAAA